MQYTIKTFAKQGALAALCIAIYGCGAGSYDRNQQVSIRDKHTIAYSVNAEKRVHPRLLLQGQVNNFKITDSQDLINNGYSLDVVLANNTLWEGPTKLNQEVSLRDAGLVLLASPVNNERLEINLGGGIRYLDGDLNLSTTAQQENIELVGKTGLSINSYVKYKFSPVLAFSAGATGGHFESERRSMMINAGLHWTPIKHLQFDFGYFYYGYENNISDRNSSTSDYQLQSRRIHKDFGEDNIASCNDDIPNPSCPQGNYDSAVQVETRGLKAGVTFAF